jgi:hypothetical protein
MLFLLTLLGLILNSWAQTVTPPLPVYPQAPTPSQALSCINNATGFGLLTQQDAYRLCLGATSQAPLDCYRQAVRSLVDENTALKLCRCAVSTDRVSCFQQAQSTTGLATDQILDICTHDIASTAPGCNPIS